MFYEVDGRTRKNRSSVTDGDAPPRRVRVAGAPGQTLAQDAEGVPPTPRGERRKRRPRGKPPWRCVRYNRFRPTMLPLPAYPPIGQKALCLPS
jgi:hypothetical protein